MNGTENQSAIYTGKIHHRRFVAGEHRFTYPMAMLYLDLAELPTLFDKIPFWSSRRFNLGRFCESDYLADEPGQTLMARVNHTLLRTTGKIAAGPVRLLTHPRYLGFAINPISCFYCFAKDGKTLQYLIAEVTNTPWRERIAYVLPVDPDKNLHTSRFAKQMHVSPFNPMEMDYVARFNTAGNKLYLHLENRIATDHDETVVNDATLTLQRKPLTRANLLQLLWQFPLMTLQVAIGIYWQALQLWLRGAKFHQHPSPSHPANPKKIFSTQEMRP